MLQPDSSCIGTEQLVCLTSSAAFCLFQISRSMLPIVGRVLTCLFLELCSALKKLEPRRRLTICHVLQAGKRSATKSNHAVPASEAMVTGTVSAEQSGGVASVHITHAQTLGRPRRARHVPSKCRSSQCPHLPHDHRSVVQMPSISLHTTLRAQHCNCAKPNAFQ